MIKIKNHSDVELLVFDFDGVMTNNKAYVNEMGEEFVGVSRADGLGIGYMRKMGIKMIILSSEVNKVVTKRGEKLKIDVIQGVESKESALKLYCEKNNISLKNVAYVGNDLNDLEVMKIVGLRICPADAYIGIKEISDIVLSSKGGEGVAREIYENLKCVPLDEKSINSNYTGCTCRLCNSTKIKRRPGRVRDNEKLHVLECLECGLVFLSSFEHINAEFYGDSGMHGGLIEIESWVAETSVDDERRFVFLKDMIKDKRILDIGCGNGGFAKRAKSIGKSVDVVEPDKGIHDFLSDVFDNIYSDVADVKEKYDIITLFHVLEHIEEPLKFLKDVSEHLDKTGKLIIEVPNSEDVLLRLYENDAFSNFTYWSCHLFLYNSKTLETLLKRADFTPCSITQIQRYPISNHLYWLAKGKPGGHKIWDFINEPELNIRYENKLAELGMCDTIIGIFEKKK